MWHNQSILDAFPIPDRYPDHETYYFFNDNDEETYDAFEMFRFYDAYFFHDTLQASFVKWSSRMTLCAGTCQMTYPGSCTITLSKPLLQFRTNNNLKETLIHEMIHAYLFITNPKACRDHGGHGKEFQDIMVNINSITGLNISIYHTFHDEVDYHRKHVWKCDGPCKDRAPYFGYVKRAMNRAPGPKDPWWSEHEKKCGGKYTKIEGPEMNQENQSQKPKKERRKRKDEPQNTINNYFKKTKTNSREDTPNQDDEDRPRVYLYLIKPGEHVQKDNENSQSLPSKDIEKDNSKSIIDLDQTDQSFMSNSIFDTPRTDFTTQSSTPPQTQKKTPGKIGNLNDFMKGILSGNNESQNSTVSKHPSIKKALNDTENSNSQQINIADMLKKYQDNKPEKNITAPTDFISADKLIKKNKTQTPQKETGASQSGYVYGFLISRENHPYLQNFWTRIFINSKCSIKEILQITDFASPTNYEEKEIFIKGKFIMNHDQALSDLGLAQGSLLEDEVNDLTMRVEKIFSLDQVNNAKVLQAKQIPVCLGASYFDKEGQVVEDNKKRIEDINQKILEQF